MIDISVVQICRGVDLVDRGRGVRFEIEIDGHVTPAFVIRYDGAVFGYVNQCVHMSMELDWQEGEFFEKTGQYLICATHGVIFEPNTGRCVTDLCSGSWLRKLNIVERGTGADSVIFFVQTDTGTSIDVPVSCDHSLS
ncbi:Rieske (2Fe-2S) protein [Candidatus Pandoraea novymonadis]|uniref:Rieske domain-containing protein n=1 Tax=Candidatus Pandoraea novymonadis TaxID=1808959 RepID=A0ABX5FCZ6_9BURK|nr:Rieske 2Fe-2S domain-containing protein [Candidatus Pandoraea novymonadis]PSB91655.1 hypothetical protein BZL35_00872 [Candidatus Pandoraea novymonadis]